MSRESADVEAFSPESRDLSRCRIPTVAPIIPGVASGELLMWLGRDAYPTPWWVSAVYPGFFLVASSRCFRTARRLKADELVARLYVGLGSPSLACAELAWEACDALLGISSPSPSIADIGYFAGPSSCGIGVWHRRARTPAAWLCRVPVGNLGIISSSIPLAYFVSVPRLHALILFALTANAGSPRPMNRSTAIASH